MICRLCLPDFESLLKVVNDSAQVYKGVIPADRWKEPYMHAEELREEIKDGVQFYGWWEDCTLAGVMGIQQVGSVTLMRHAYVLPIYQRKGIGAKLLEHLLAMAGTDVVLVGTWEAASWAIRFYEKNGFRVVSKAEKDRLLRKFWRIPERQIETSLVLRYDKNHHQKRNAVHAQESGGSIGVEHLQ
jgi:GNAT superfamily N-acetyltransferase